MAHGPVSTAPLPNSERRWPSRSRNSGTSPRRSSFSPAQWRRKAFVVDKSLAINKGTKYINRMSKHFGCPAQIEMVRIKYFNNPVEQDQCFIKRRVRSMRDIKSVKLAASSIAGIKLVKMIRKRQFRWEVGPFDQFCKPAACSCSCSCRRHFPLAHTGMLAKEHLWRSPKIDALKCSYQPSPS